MSQGLLGSHGIRTLPNLVTELVHLSNLSSIPLFRTELDLGKKVKGIEIICEKVIIIFSSLNYFSLQ